MTFTQNKQRVNIVNKMINSPEPLLIVAGEQNSVLYKFPAASFQQPDSITPAESNGIWSENDSQQLPALIFCPDHRKKITEK